MHPSQNVSGPISSRIAQSTAFNGVNLLDGSTSSIDLHVGAGTTVGVDTLSFTFTSILASDIGISGPFLSLSGEYHYSHRGKGSGFDNGIITAGGSAGYDTRMLRLEAGSFFQQFKYDYFRDLDERADVRTYFGELKLRLPDWLTTRIRYEYEIFDRSIHTVSLDLRHSF